MSETREHVLHLGPDDAGRVLEHDEFERAEWAPGYRYELVAGRLAVTPAPNLRHAIVQSWLLKRLVLYAAERPHLLREILPVSRLITRDQGATTDVEPDLAAYRTFTSSRSATWRDNSPVLVVEVLSASDPEKDTERNPGIYWRVPSIKEYWIVDPRPIAGPSMTALVRGRDGWLERAVAPGGTYTTDLLPGLVLDLSTIFTDA